MDESRQMYNKVEIRMKEEEQPVDCPSKVQIAVASDISCLQNYPAGLINTQAQPDFHDCCVYRQTLEG